MRGSAFKTNVPRGRSLEWTVCAGVRGRNLGHSSTGKAVPSGRL